MQYWRGFQAVLNDEGLGSRRVPSSERRGGCDIKPLDGADGVVRTSKTFWNDAPPRLCALRSAIARNSLSAHPPPPRRGGDTPAPTFRAGEQPSNANLDSCAWPGGALARNRPRLRHRHQKRGRNCRPSGFFRYRERYPAGTRNRRRHHRRRNLPRHHRSRSRMSPHQSYPRYLVTNRSRVRVRRRFPMWVCRIRDCCPEQTICCSTGTRRHRCRLQAIGAASHRRTVFSSVQES